MGTDIGQDAWQGYLLYAAFLQASMAEAGRGQMGRNSTAVCVPHHNQTIIATCHQGMIALQCFSSWVSGCTCLLVLTDATKMDKTEGLGVLGGVRQRWWPRVIPRGTLCNEHTAIASGMTHMVIVCSI